MKFTTNFCAHLFKAGLLSLSAIYSTQSNAQFTYGNVTVLQAGDGASALANTGNPIVLKEYSPSGALTYSMAVPSTSTNALVMSGSAGSEGFLSLSADKRYLVFGGYARALPNSTALPGATASSVNRGIGLVGGAGFSSYSLVATSTSFFTGSNIRGATAANRRNVWASGGNQGSNYFGTAAPPVTVQNTKTNLRAISIFNGQLYCSSQVVSGTPGDIGIYAIGSGTPVTNGQQVTTVINTGTGSQPAQFYFNSSGDLCYIADQRNGSGGGIQKWTLSSSGWSLAYTLPTGTTTIGATGVVADLSGSIPKVYATTNESNGNRLICISDNGASSTATTLATATSGAVFKGLAFSPCSMPMVTASASSMSVCANQTLMLNAGTTGPVSCYWAGPGQFTNPNSASITVTATASGIYTVIAANGCGSDTAHIAITVNPLPVITTNSTVVCAGQAATLTASGATTYTWSTGGNNPSLTIAPSASSSYTVSGSSSFGCIATATTQIIVASGPTITASSGSVCAGSSLTLTASGATTYTWSTAVSGHSIVVTPSVNTSYTVSGMLSGCPGIDVQVSSVLVTPQPSLSISGIQSTCPGIPVLLTASGVETYSWSNGASTPSVIVSPLVTTIYTVSGTDHNGCSAIANVTVNIVNGPALNISATPPYLCYGASTSATLFASGAATYTWSDGSSSPSLAVTQSESSSYTLTGSIGPSCSSTTQFQLHTLICEGIEQFGNEQTARVYPNPATQEVQFDFNDQRTRHIRLVNVLGQCIYNGLHNNTSHFNVSSFQRGLYTLIIDDTNKRLCIKLLLD